VNSWGIAGKGFTALDTLSTIGLLKSSVKPFPGFEDRFGFHLSTHE
jgi:hypothetical protein